MKFSGVLTVSASLCFCGYGLIRLAGKAGGLYGPGFAWQAAHLAGLAAVVLFVPVVLGLGGELPRTAARSGVVAVTIAGLIAAIIQFGADIVVAAMASDNARMNELYHDFWTIPGIHLAVYTVGPQLFYLGLVVLAILLARAGRLPWWSPVMLIASVLLSAISLDLISLASFGILGALLPVARRGGLPADDAAAL
ncbi:hypothetical protein [Nocardia arthritidis]|uniref:DUF4386 family protein n=1 Tax=Nocardia arthritidis TaxID=228602 RepID=A0A6G9YDY1_9NOCA|nr:hypothetical protein [Nocardia arthritidis]QIS11485.1 hypothetical protein F5544_18055 [Nocardia arthritidis]